MVILTVDTAKDTPEQIRRTIAYLQEAIAESPVSLPEKRSEPRDLVEEFLGVEFFKQEDSSDGPKGGQELKDAAKTAANEPKDPAAILREVARRPVEKRQEKPSPLKPEKDDGQSAILSDEPETFIEIVEYD